MNFVKNVKYISGYKLELTFKDGLQGIIDLEDELWGEVFEPLKDIEEFKKVRVDSELDTIVWPTGADLAPEFLYESVLQSNVAAKSEAHTVQE
ncbi:MAG TPA: DUF2442 domain-containing protein [Candidatus Kapabacteria bacterium]|jgi:hypothetical protein|nr:DUF2442 domain-containing protein [Candidatus Kapabacteria bacterium]